MRHLLWVVVLAVSACPDTENTPADAPVTLEAGADGPPIDSGPTPDAGPDQALADSGLEAGASDAVASEAGAPQGLPFTYTRPPAGQPVTQTELQAITDTYIDLLKQTRYFDVLDERIHGWPQSDPKQRYWYGTFWSGVTIVKQNGAVTYLHSKGGADNNGLRTGPVLEGACFATKLWGTPKLEQLTRRMIRGFSSWILAMERYPNDPTAGTILTRAAYPESITSTDGNRTIHIDYSLNHPGDDNGACEYVHLPQNPHWGDLWVKNKRSKDCIGHMVRAIATLHDCAGALGADAAKDRAEMEARYVAWAKRVEQDSWTIATWDKQAQLWFPSDMLAHFIGLGNAECNSMLSLRLLGQGNPGTLACGNGIHPLEWIVLQNDHNGEIVRSFHEAAVKQALLTQQNTVAKTMLAGLAQRIEEGLKIAQTGNWPVHMNEDDLADLILHSAAAGVPLTWDEVRYVHQQIAKAHTEYVTNTPATYYRIFDSTTPDGSYPYKPGAAAMAFRSLALAIGTCTATYLNPTTNPVLDCGRLESSWAP